jgi:UDP-glucose 4-epimerase
MGARPEVVHLAPRHEVQHVHAAHEKVRRVFGGRPVTPLCEGLGRTAAWVRELGARTSSPFSGIEITRNLPESWRD